MAHMSSQLPGTRRPHVLLPRGLEDGMQRRPILAASKGFGTARLTSRAKGGGSSNICKLSAIQKHGILDFLAPRLSRSSGQFYSMVRAEAVECEKASGPVVSYTGVQGPRGFCEFFRGVQCAVGGKLNSSSLPPAAQHALSLHVACMVVYIDPTVRMIW